MARRNELSRSLSLASWSDVADSGDMAARSHRRRALVDTLIQLGIEKTE